MLTHSVTSQVVDVIYTTIATPDTLLLGQGCVKEGTSDPRTILPKPSCAYVMQLALQPRLQSVSIMGFYFFREYPVIRVTDERAHGGRTS